jgi:hypothetical protein
VAAPKRGSETLLDMARSLGLIGAIIAFTLLFVPGLIHPGSKDRLQPVDYSSYVSGFHDVTGVTAMTPRPAPDGFRPTSGRLTGPAATEHLHIGFAVPGTTYAGVEESVGPLPTLVAALLGKRGATVTGHAVIAGVTWQSRLSSRGEVALTRRVAGLNLLVTGSASAEQLELLAGSLH